jgi:hypothetical protein
MPEPEIISETDFRFSVLFSAIAVNGQMLRYQGECHFLADTKDVNIYPWIESIEKPTSANDVGGNEEKEG